MFLFPIRTFVELTGSESVLELHFKTFLEIFDHILSLKCSKKVLEIIGTVSVLSHFPQMFWIYSKKTVLEQFQNIRFRTQIWNSSRTVPISRTNL